MKRIAIALAGSVVLASCSADPVGTQVEDSAERNAALEEVLAHERRNDDRARDEFRHPAETLAFFQVEPDHTVIEYAPGGGWYSRILAPYLAENGRYFAVSFPPEAAAPLGEEFVERVRGFGESFSGEQSEALGLPPEKVPFYYTNAIPEDLNGAVDRVLMIRMMHNLIRWGVADSEIEALVKTLKPGGLFGVVQHRAKPDAPEDYVDGNKGYLTQDDLIAFFEGKGLELVDTSEINANPKDTADYEDGVWTLPPSYAKGDEDRGTYAAIGESDRMTLLFRKAE
ncbi:class I SAM-dependent methyltransferase [Erythrobacter sp. THAF29]|uniref:class I SAM-dependent methyltransferase n=1 Tax=Erythrobacter sp. THAF29 TaxID=2587851 RepID=UPI0012693A1B|nr:class I SAM-dependent methyltransferase [Erythrobacter sp. THAF29]QFT76756.1 hypothetical protein FIU90_04275 [Erythrobacter sp. THAF29]